MIRYQFIDSEIAIAIAKKRSFGFHSF